MNRIALPSQARLKSSIAPRRRRPDADSVLRRLDEMCATLQPGDSIPTHTELMRRFDASERSVLRALDELQRVGKVVRRNGVGTFVADASSMAGNNGSVVPASVADSRTVIAIVKPDQSFFDHAIRLLFRQVEAADLSLASRFLDPATSTLPAAPAEASRPLGYILFRQDLLPLARQLQDAGNRVVLVGTPDAGAKLEVPNVYGDQQKGGYLATQHLIELGHRRVAFCGLPGTMQSRRWKGHERALADARRKGLEITSSVLFLEEVEQWKRVPEKAQQYFKSSNAPTGIVVWNDHEAIGVLSTLARAGIRVPEDVSIIGYDDLPEGRRVHPPLTTIDSAVEQQLQAALDILTDSAPVGSTHTVVVLPALVKRESCAAPSHKSVPVVAVEIS
jgi:DNA-binding LacI/PurR family transcriptional regulator